MFNYFSIVALAAGLIGMCAANLHAAETKLPIAISGGHETDPRDGGRPVVLVAGALEVPPEVFRDAFKGVTPSRNGPPSREQAQKNKRALMKAFAPHGVTNDRLDEVSNYYRYRPQAGELWPTSDAKAYAVVEDGKIKQIVVTDPGSGYSSSPQATIKELPNVRLNATLDFNKDFKKNGAIRSIEVVAPKDSTAK